MTAEFRVLKNAENCLMLLTSTGHTTIFRISNGSVPRRYGGPIAFAVKGVILKKQYAVQGKGLRRIARKSFDCVRGFIRPISLLNEKNSCTIAKKFIIFIRADGEAVRLSHLRIWKILKLMFNNMSKTRDRKC